MNNRGISGHPLIALGQTPSLRSAVINLFLFTRHTYYFRLNMAFIQHKQTTHQGTKEWCKRKPLLHCVCVLDGELLKSRTVGHERVWPFSQI